MAKKKFIPEFYITAENADAVIAALEESEKVEKQEYSGNFKTDTEMTVEETKHFLDLCFAKAMANSEQ